MAIKVDNQAAEIAEDTTKVNDTRYFFKYEAEELWQRYYGLSDIAEKMDDEELNEVLSSLGEAIESIENKAEDFAFIYMELINEENGVE